MENEQKKKQWKRMSEKEKLEWNGFAGFCKGEKRKNTNLFMPKRLRK